MYILPTLNKVLFYSSILFYIRNEFETVDGMPVYYGGDLCDSDDSEDSEWEDPWNLVYAEYVDQYNFYALDGMELKVYELTDGYDVSRVADPPIHGTSGVPDGGGVALYYEGDLSDSDCGSVADRERDTWDDWCDSAFCNGFGGFPPGMRIHSHQWCSVISCFGMTIWPSRHEYCRNLDMRRCRLRRFSRVR